MQLKTRGIVLQSTEYSESSLVVKIYTEESGMGSFIVSGVRSKKPRFPMSAFQPLSLVEIVANGNAGQSMLRITDIKMSPPLNGISGNTIKSTISIFLAEVVYRSIKEESPNPALFGFLHHSIQALDIAEESCSGFHIYFLIRFSRHLGFFPNGQFEEGLTIFDLRDGLFKTGVPVHKEFLGPKASSHLFRIMNATFETYYLEDIKLAERKELLKGLVFYFELHQTHGNVIRSHKVLEEILH